MPETIKISSLKIKFKEILELIDDAIEKRKKIELSSESLNQKNNTILLLKWLQKHKIIELEPIIINIQKRQTIKSRHIKKQISLQLKVLGASIDEIAGIFGVKSVTVKGYLKELGDFDQKYTQVLKLILNLKGISKKTPLDEFPLFPIRISIKKIKDSMKKAEYDEFENDFHTNKWIKLITGKDLGTQDLSILLPKK